MLERIGKHEVCDPGYYKVALAVAPNEDYHWFRQNSDGTWSHKPGSRDVRNFEDSGKIIFDPETCNRIIYNVNYSVFIDFYQINITSMI